MPHVCGDEPGRGREPATTGRMPHVCGDEPGRAGNRRGRPRMPHVCGDEPRERHMSADQVPVCPTYVGMNRQLLLDTIEIIGMPHVCGDEPSRGTRKRVNFMYAPRMWG